MVTLLKTAFVLLLVGSLTHQAQAQEVIATNDDGSFARNSVFVELGGNALLYSVNYDHKFFDHASARIGAMYFSVSADDPNSLNGRVSVFLAPIMANYLVGDGNSRLELGAGLVVAGASGSGTVDNEQLDEFRGGGVGFTSTVGYRLQPRDGGFLFRIGFTPIIAPGTFIPWFGLSFGASF